MDSQSKKQCNDNGKESQWSKKVPGIFSRTMFLWLYPLFYDGYRRGLEQEDLLPPKETFISKNAGDKLERKWLEEEVLAKSEGRDPSITRALLKAFGWYIVPSGILQFMNVIFRTISPLIFAEILKYWSEIKLTTLENASYYAIAMVLSNVLAAICFHHGQLSGQQFGMLLRIATSSLIFRKLMRLDSSALGEATAGKVVNIMSNDLQRFELSFMYIHTIWIVPIQITIVICICYAEAGLAPVIGCVLLIVSSLPIQAILAKLVGKARLFTTQKADIRVKVMNEVISGIQIIKMYAWEKPFTKLVQEKREEELKGVKSTITLRSIMMGFVIFNERFAIFATVLVYSLLGHNLSASMIYPLQQLLVSLRLTFALILPLLLSFLSEVTVTLSRIEEFMKLKERPDLANRINLPSLIKTNTNTEKSSITAISYKEANHFINNGLCLDETKVAKGLNDINNAIEIRNLSASWCGSSNDLTLKNISISFPKGKLSAIIGPVGAGKSSILDLILKELSACSGEISLFGKVSYACQDAWLLTNTVRENIVFGLPFMENKYKQVCKACALEKDFQQLPYGDQTLVGERGVMISGGQRARINFARAVYREADIYLLDDPLSAVDANVGRQLFEGCINGYLRGRTRILVTHQVHFLKAADYIVVMNEGKVEATGSYNDLVSSRNKLAKMLASSQENKNEDENLLSAATTKEKQLRIQGISDSENDTEIHQFEAQKMAAEKRESGNMRWEVLREYFTCGSHWTFVVFTFVLIFISSATSGMCDYWISYWTNQMEKYEKQHNGTETESGWSLKVGKYTIAQYIIFHGCFVALGIFLTNLRTIPFVKLSLASCNELHKRMFTTMLSGTMRFFDGNSSGRILNRFVKDVGAVDDSLPKVVLELAQVYSNIAVIIILNAVALYWTLIPSTILILISVGFIKIYIRGAQGIKRLESTCKSPVFDMVTSTLSGISTLRACEAQNRFIEEFDKHQDLHTYAWNGLLCGGEGFGTLLDIMCMLNLSVILFAALYIDFGDILPVGDVGLAITQSIMLISMLQFGVRIIVEFIAQLTSVERMLEYTHIVTEDNITEGEIATPSSWPNKGKIVFEDVTLYYNLNDAPVLKNLDIIIESGSKIGIVGRTGAGKSSLISAIFRFAHIEGKIIIDDVETSVISKQDLRSNISIIPQEPVLFSATIRYNLDPFDLYKDEEIWKALELVDMKSVVTSLDYKVTEGGANFSVGQRQLICLARAVLRSNKILIMDEATANVDPQTDNFIQQTIRNQFASCTVLTIAHRLNTVMDSDQVLVMDGGEIVEYNHPYILISNPESKFSSMVRETGDKNYNQLCKIAKDAYIDRNKGLDNSEYTLKDHH